MLLLMYLSKELCITTYKYSPNTPFNKITSISNILNYGWYLDVL